MPRSKRFVYLNKHAAQIVDEAVTLTEQSVAELRALVHHITVEGGVHGNPYCDDSVKRALKFLAHQDGITDYLSVKTEAK
jgi:hypothetical protein